MLRRALFFSVIYTAVGLSSMKTNTAVLEEDSRKHDGEAVRTGHGHIHNGIGSDVTKTLTGSRTAAYEVDHHGDAASLELAKDQASFEKQKGDDLTDTYTDFDNVDLWPKQSTYHAKFKGDDTFNASFSESVPTFDAVPATEYPALVWSREGAFGIATLYQTKDGSEVIIKHAKDSEDSGDIVKEAEILKKLTDVSGVVNFRDMFYVRTNDGSTAYLVEDFLSGRSLADEVDEGDNGWDYFVNTLTAAQKLQIMQSLDTTVTTCHGEKQVAHLDIKPQHIILQEGGEGTFLPTIIDFDTATDGSLSVLGSEGGSSNWGSPAQLRWQALPDDAKPDDGFNIYDADNWSLGMTLFFLVTGKRPNYNKDPVAAERFKDEEVVSRLSALQSDHAAEFKKTIFRLLGIPMTEE